jgi:hypothetical protein
VNSRVRNTRTHLFPRFPTLEHKSGAVNRQKALFSSYDNDLDNKTQVFYENISLKNQCMGNGFESAL